MKLYGIHSYNIEVPSLKHNEVILAEDEEDARREWEKDFNNITYRAIEQIKRINMEDCTVEYQLGFDIKYREKAEWTILGQTIDIQDKRQTEYSLLVKNNNTMGTLFPKGYVHSDEDGVIEVKINLANNEPTY